MARNVSENTAEHAIARRSCVARLLPYFILALLIPLPSHAASDWPQWRGPNRDGQATGFKAPAHWPAQLQKRWQVDVGLGRSSPIVAGPNAYVFSRREELEVLACIRLADGKELWHGSYAAPYEFDSPSDGHDKGPQSTPVVVDTHILTFGINSTLTCWIRSNGRIKWQRDFSKLFKEAGPLESAMSPVVEGDKCIVHVGGQEHGALLALNLHDGATLWSWSGDGPGDASPIVATLDGERQIVTQSAKACVGVDIDDGALLWSIPYQNEGDRNSVTPLAHEGSIIFSCSDNGLDRYHVERVDEQWEADSSWDNKEVSLGLSSPVIEGDRLFGFSHRHKGQLFAVDLTTGKTLWTSAGRLGESAALVGTGKVLWALTTAGELLVLKASDTEYQELARYKVATTATWAHPVILPDGVLIKDESKLTSWKLSLAP